MKQIVFEAANGSCGVRAINNYGIVDDAEFYGSKDLVLSALNQDLHSDRDIDVLYASIILGALKRSNAL